MAKAVAILRSVEAVMLAGVGKQERETLVAQLRMALHNLQDEEGAR